MKLIGPIWLMQPIPYYGEKLKGAWIVEPKIDGWRMQIIKYSGGKVECWGRRLDRKPEWSDKLKFIQKATKNLPNGILLDCELYSTRGRRFVPSLFSDTGRAKPLIFIFDIVFFENTFVGNLELKVRKTLIKRLKLKPPMYELEYKIHNGKLENVFSKRYKETEGIILKNAASIYKTGKDAPLASHDWRKIRWR